MSIWIAISLVAVVITCMQLRAAWQPISMIFRFQKLASEAGGKVTESIHWTDDHLHYCIEHFGESKVSWNMLIKYKITKKLIILHMAGHVYLIKTKFYSDKQIADIKAFLAGVKK